MSSLLWQSWPRITFNESQKLLKFFASKDEVVRYRSNHRHLLGAVGQGIVVFKGSETARQLLEGNRENSLNLRHVFEPSLDVARSAPSPATQEATVERGEDASTGPPSRSPEAISKAATNGPDDKAWTVSIRNLQKTPEDIFIEYLDIEGHYKSASKAKQDLDNYRIGILSELESFNPDVNHFISEAFGNHVEKIGETIKVRRHKINEVKNQDTRRRKQAGQQAADAAVRLESENVVNAAEHSRLT